MLRTGLGYDLHRLMPGKDLVIGGVRLKSDTGAVAHSDGDALVHAVIDALLSPLGAGDIGALYPDSDPKWKGADSLSLLRDVRERFLSGVTVHNIDAVVVIDAPRIGPHVPEMKRNIARALGIGEDRVGIKGKTTENTKIYALESYATVLLDVPGAEEKNKE